MNAVLVRPPIARLLMPLGLALVMAGCGSTFETPSAAGATSLAKPSPAASPSASFLPTARGFAEHGAEALFRDTHVVGSSTP